MLDGVKVFQSFIIDLPYWNNLQNYKKLNNGKNTITCPEYDVCKSLYEYILCNICQSMIREKKMV